MTRSRRDAGERGYIFHASLRCPERESLVEIGAELAVSGLEGETGIAQVRRGKDDTVGLCAS